jgi:hypothetical protein
MGAHETAIRRSVAERAEGKRHSAEELMQLEQELEGLRPRSLESERQLDVAKNELGLKRNRLRALEDLHRRLEGVGTGVRALLSSGDAGVLGMVADHLEVAIRRVASLPTSGFGDHRWTRARSRSSIRSIHGRGRATIAPRSPPASPARSPR